MVKPPSFLQSSELETSLYENPSMSLPFTSIKGLRLPLMSHGPGPGLGCQVAVVARAVRLV